MNAISAYNGKESPPNIISRDMHIIEDAIAAIYFPLVLLKILYIKNALREVNNTCINATDNKIYEYINKTLKIRK